MTSRCYILFYQMKLVVIFAIFFTIIIQPNFAQVGLNCTGGDDCDEQAPCPPGSELDKITGKCICNPDHCMPSPPCRYTSKVIIKHNATRLPGDCCDIYECIIPEEPNCTGVECPVDDITCPSDSLKLPRRHIEGECCGIPGGCECLPAPCPKPDCQPGFKEKVIQPGTNKPGSCCPTYECQPYKKEAVRNTCKHEGKEIPDGEKWKRGNCQECICTKGEIHCTPIVECPPLPKNCPLTAYTESSCCPLCYHDETVKELVPPEGCKSGLGKIIKNDESWYEDECTKCTCVKGEAKCLAAYCITNTCQNATWEEGDCCPRCNGDSLVITPSHCPQDISCNMKCKNGFVKDDSNCFICKCKEDECKLHCPNGYLKDENGVEICECADVKTECPSLSNCPKKCKYGYKVNKKGCPICKCDHACKAVDHSCKKNCPHGLQTDHKGCLICKCRGSPYSSETNTSAQMEQECNTDVDIWRDDGEAWNDGCRQCYCHKGKEMCALIACPKLDCPDPVVAKKSCCPTCPGNDTRLATQVVCYGPDGLLKLEGESWSIGGCINCICHGGRVMCNREVCAPSPCSHPLPPQPGECCPTCTEDMQPTITSLQGCGDDRPAGSTWREGNCVSCICANGIASCFTETCHQIDINCKTPLQVKNLCCSICLDGSLHDEATCRVGNVTFNLGDQWEPDKCRRCTCDQGRTITCVQTICETTCSNNNENLCCPKCRDSEGITDFLYIFLLCAVMCLCGAGMVFAGRLCCLRRHQLKICQPHPPAYPYKYVPTFEGPTTQTSPLTLKSPV